MMMFVLVMISMMTVTVATTMIIKTIVADRPDLPVMAMESVLRLDLDQMIEQLPMIVAALMRMTAVTTVTIWTTVVIVAMTSITRIMIVTMTIPKVTTMIATVVTL